MRPLRHRGDGRPRWPREATAGTLTAGMLVAAALCAPAIASGGTPLRAQDSDSPAAPAAQDALEAATEDLIAAYEVAYEAFLDARDDAIAVYLAERETDENARYSAPESPDGAFFDRFAALAERGSLRAQAWCVTHYTPGDGIADPRADFTRRVLDCLAQPSGDQGAIVRAIARRSPSRYSPTAVLDLDTAAALLHLAEIALDEVEARATAGYELGSKLVQRDSSRARGLDVLRRVAKDYAGLETGERASSYVFELENLQIGMVAPEIVGEDVDGNPMKLTDFRGKVVVLDFWGFW